MVIKARLAVIAVVTALAAALSGCSTPDRSSPSTTTIAAATTTTTPTTTTTKSTTKTTTKTTTSAPDGPARHGTADGLSITLAPQAGTTVTPGGPPLSFNLALLNTTPADMTQVGLVVSLGHCGCGSPEEHMMPLGSLRVLDPNTRQWVAAPYNRQAGGMDFILQTFTAPFGIKAGQIINYQFELQLDAQQDFTVGKGDGAVNVTRTDAAHNAIGPSPAAALRITVEPK